jgi:hypothetical protein
MLVEIQDFLEDCGLDEPLYPGKRVVKKLPQPGEFKSHCVVYDWRDADKIRIEVKAGLTGRDLPPSELKKYPVSFQSPTYIELDVGDQKPTEKKSKAKKGKK